MLIVLAACGAPPRPSPASAPPPPARDLAVAEPVKAQPLPPPRRDRDLAIVLGARDEVPGIGRRVLQPGEIAVAERDLWSPCVRDFVAGQPAATRRALTAAFARFPTSCDAEKRVVLEAPREYGERYVVFRGPLTAMTFDVVCGTPGPAVAIVHDGQRWTGTATSTQLGACTTTSVPDMPSLRRVLREVAEARDATAQDVVITDDMKRDLRLVLDALDALSAR